MSSSQDLGGPGPKTTPDTQLPHLVSIRMVPSPLCWGPCAGEPESSLNGRVGREAAGAGQSQEHSAGSSDLEWPPWRLAKAQSPPLSIL